MRKRGRIAALVLAATALAVPLLTQAAGANLPGSTFEGNDGNLVVNTAGNTDWTNAPNRALGTDQINSQTDNSFGQGTKEDLTNVTVVSGSIPNNKADLATFYEANEQLVNGNIMLYLGWSRANQNGTVNFDFEINQKAQPDLTTPGAKVLNRTNGDILINYLFQGQGTPTVNFRLWQGTQWSAPVDASAFSEAAINGVPVANIAGQNPNPIPAAQFGELAINLTAAGVFPPGVCEAFGSAYVKSRSSTSFQSEIKDFVAPVSLNIANCAGIIVKKVTVPSPDPTNTSFDFASNFASPNNFSLANGGSKSTTGLNPGSGYHVAETVPTGWISDGGVCDDGSPVSNISLSQGETVTCTFTNTAQGHIIVKKVTDPAGSPQGFDFTSNYGAGFTLHDGEQNDSGAINAGSYNVGETVPAGWDNTSHTCDNGNDPSAITLGPGQTVTCTFKNVQRSNIVVNKVTVPSPDPTNTSFDFASNYGPNFSLKNGGSNDSGLIVPGSYNVGETVPANWKLTGHTCDNGNDPSAITLAAGTTVHCTFTNTLQTGAIQVTKTAKQKSAGGVVPQGNVTFDITPGPLGSPSTQITTGPNGIACVAGLFLGDYNLHEEVPAGYAPVADQTVHVTATGDCTSGATAVAIENTPLTDITVSVNSQVDGATSSTMHCTAADNTVVADGSTGANGDGQVTGSNLVPGTYTCVVVIDP